MDSVLKFLLGMLTLGVDLAMEQIKHLLLSILS
jgi:hypothetical protein